MIPNEEKYPSADPSHRNPEQFGMPARPHLTIVGLEEGIEPDLVYLHEPKQLNRRQVIGAGLGAAALLFATGTLRQETQRNPENVELMGQNKEDAADLSRRLLVAAESIQPFVPTVSTLDQVRAFETEYVPHLAADGLVKDDALVFPPISNVDYLKSEGSLGVFHILGETDCQDPNSPVTLNDRFFTPYSPWRERNDTGLLIATVAHEVAHANKVSCTPFDPDTESATQMVSMNTLAGMVMEGNNLALPAFLNQLGEFADDFVLSECLTEEDTLIAKRTPPTPTPTPSPYAGYYPDYGGEPTKAPIPDVHKFRSDAGLGWYEQYLGRLPNGAIEQARWDRSLDYWLRTDWQQLNDIISKYGAAPYKYTSQAMNDRDFKSPNLPISGDMSLNADDISLTMFSTHYVLTHLDALVAAYQKGNR